MIQNVSGYVRPSPQDLSTTEQGKNPVQTATGKGDAKNKPDATGQADAANGSANSAQSSSSVLFGGALSQISQSPPPASGANTQAIYRPGDLLKLKV